MASMLYLLLEQKYGYFGFVNVSWKTIKKFCYGLKIGIFPNQGHNDIMSYILDKTNNFIIFYELYY